MGGRIDHVSRCRCQRRSLPTRRAYDTDLSDGQWSLIEPTIPLARAAMGGLSSASFYAAFKSKEALFRGAVRRYLDPHGQVVASLYDPKAAPRDAVERALRGSARMQTDPSHPAGAWSCCPP